MYTLDCYPCSRPLAVNSLCRPFFFPNCVRFQNERRNSSDGINHMDYSTSHCLCRWEQTRLCHWSPHAHTHTNIFSKCIYKMNSITGRIVNCVYFIFAYLLTPFERKRDWSEVLTQFFVSLNKVEMNTEKTDHHLPIWPGILYNLWYLGLWVLRFIHPHITKYARSSSLSFCSCHLYRRQRHSHSHIIIIATKRHLSQSFHTHTHTAETTKNMLLKLFSLLSGSPLSSTGWTTSDKHHSTSDPFYVSLAVLESCINMLSHTFTLCKNCKSQLPYFWPTVFYNDSLPMTIATE